MVQGSVPVEKKKILVVFPTAWDRRQIQASRGSWREQFDIQLAEPADDEWAWNYDVLGFLERQSALAKGAIDGVFSSSDYPGATLAGAISRKLGLPGTRPDRIIRCSHKYYSRLAQRDSVPEATPWFQLVDPRLSRGGLRSLSFPCFIKPVKGAFSILSTRLDCWEALEAFLGKPSVSAFLSSYVHAFNQLVRALTDFEVDGSFFLVEDFLKGRQVTVEGFVAGRGVEILGIVDSVRHPRTKSFVRFDYPSSLPRRIQERMTVLTRKLIERLELRSTLFNVEMTYDGRRDRIFVVEVNPRMCGQFADLYEKVDGTNGYEVAIAVAAGETPSLRKGSGACGAASSFPLRIFEPSRAVRAPSAAEIARVEEAHPGTLIWSECSRGDLLDDFETFEDGKSFRYAVVNLGAEDREEIQLRFGEVSRALDYRFEPVRGDALQARNDAPSCSERHRPR